MRPQALTTGADELTVIGAIVPLSVSVSRNGLTTPGACSVTLNYTDAPFDPRSLRACGVEVLIGVVPPDEYAAGIGQGVTRADGSLVSMVGEAPDGWVRGATRFVGFVDEWSVKYSGDDGDTVALECRDMSAPLRDLKVPTGASVDLALPIDQGVQRYLDAISPGTAGVIVRWLGEGDPPTPVQSAPARRRPRRGKVARRTKRGDADMTAWDHIVDVCASGGLVPMVRGFEVVISEARTLYNTDDALRMVYGRNIDELEFKRRLGGVKVPTIEVRCYDPNLGRTRWARWPIPGGSDAAGIFGINNPPRALRPNEVTPSGANPSESIRTVFVSGVTDPVVLARIARNAFQQIGRQEIEGQLSTFEVSSYGVDSLEANLLDAQPADPIEILIVAATPRDTDGAISTLAELQSYTRSRRQAYLESLGWQPDVAARFAALQEANGFQTIFRVQDVRVEWSADDGLKLGLSFINYITVREDGGA